MILKRGSLDIKEFSPIIEEALRLYAGADTPIIECAPHFAAYPKPGTEITIDGALIKIIGGCYVPFGGDDFDDAILPKLAAVAIKSIHDAIMLEMNGYDADLRVPVACQKWQDQRYQLGFKSYQVGREIFTFECFADHYEVSAAAGIKINA